MSASLFIFPTIPTHFWISLVSSVVTFLCLSCLRYGTYNCWNCEEQKDRKRKIEKMCLNLPFRRCSNGCLGLLNFWPLAPHPLSNIFTFTIHPHRSTPMIYSIPSVLIKNTTKDRKRLSRFSLDSGDISPLSLISHWLLCFKQFYFARCSECLLRLLRLFEMRSVCVFCRLRWRVHVLF